MKYISLRHLFEHECTNSKNIPLGMYDRRISNFLKMNGPTTDLTMNLFAWQKKFVTNNTRIFSKKYYLNEALTGFVG